MKKALVQSVGTGTRPDIDITRPLLWHFRRSGAVLVIWIVSEESRGCAERMAEELGLTREQYEIRGVTAFEDVECVYRDCRALLRDLAARGFSAESIEVDYTSGTKAMTAGLALAAVAHGCGTLSYIAGERRAGVVISGTERLVPVEPRRLWADQRIQLAADYCQALRFDAAIELLRGLNEAWLGDYERALVAGLTATANGFGSWDRFDHPRAVGELSKLLTANPRELDLFRPDRALLERLLALKPESWITDDRLADLFNNAKRRLDEGRYDDALSRLYRLAEMLAQWVLRKEFAIDTANVELALVPEPLREGLARSSRDGGPVQIGLDWDYRLLRSYDHPIGRAFAKDGSLGALLNKRNRSLLAHGLEPIGKGEAAGLMDRLVELVSLAVPDLMDRRRVLEFPWRRSGL